MCDKIAQERSLSLKEVDSKLSFAKCFERHIIGTEHEQAASWGTGDFMAILDDQP